MATALYQSLQPKTDYIDKTRKLPPEEYFRRLDISSTVYVGNLSIYTKEEAIFDLFSRCGQIKMMKMGLNKNSKTPCGFCFIEFATHEEAGYAVDCLSHTYLDDRIIRIDWDIGFDEGRQFGRGKSGGQVRDEFRTYDDPGRGEMVKRENNYRGGHRNRDYRGGDRRDNREYRGGDRRHSGNYRHDRDRHDRNDRSRNRDEGNPDQHYKRHDSDSDQEDNYRRKKTKGE